jgi:ATPase subunit of ABC transporter with duplicated ATPase domains
MIGYWEYVITVSQLSKSFAGRALFDDVSLQVNRGDRIKFQS